MFVQLRCVLPLVIVLLNYLYQCSNVYLHVYTVVFKESADVQGL